MRLEVINDINGELINFYKVLQDDFPALQKEICATLHSRTTHRHALVVYENPDMFDRIKRAWAVWTLANMSFNNTFNSGFSRSTSGKITRKIVSKRSQFTEELCQRISGTQIEWYRRQRIEFDRRNVVTALSSFPYENLRKTIYSR